MLQLRDYMYLDSVKLQHYLSGLDAGVLAELRSTERLEEQAKATGQMDLDIAPENDLDLVRGTMHERVMQVSNFNSFARLYEPTTSLRPEINYTVHLQSAGRTKARG